MVNAGTICLNYNLDNEFIVNYGCLFDLCMLNCCLRTLNFYFNTLPSCGGFEFVSYIILRKLFARLHHLGHDLFLKLL
jgi:hypothetical protein